ncbi:MAG: hypothetical protein M1818_006402 [Claussenomyces sp. TS43310]|nr:MAG: hypothetical protein M1818_006402 [Claussenomyces sp. TS43310]
MPGILPMKVIKVGSSAQSRIAQACDRCRSKKIRCDGIRPCCSQCANVGFECKTSDKLSRRAFPRGYTESLEERVRALEGEVRELKDLLDEKDEKIDILSTMHSNKQRSQPSTNFAAATESPEEATASKDDVFCVQNSPLLLGSETSDSCVGASSGRAFIEAFKRKIQENGKSSVGFKTEVFLTAQGGPFITTGIAVPTSNVPPRLFSDRCVNVFFQEWAPLFPVLHRNTFLHLYEEYNADPESITDDHKLAQLHLVFAIAGLSSSLPDLGNAALCEREWQRSLDAIVMASTLPTLQLLLLAIIYCISKGDYQKLLHYKSIAVGLAYRLGLHQSQKRFPFGALTIETRKKVFWVLYTVDCFSAAMLGLPKLLKESDIFCEYPADIDDEYLTEKGFLPTLPCESSKVSNALALFRSSRILSKVLEQNYPAAATHELSLQSISMLDSELNKWSDSLPSHLKLTFVQDKPSTDITGNRSALLSLAYYYIRTLIHRPTIGSTLGNKASSSVMSVAESSKHMIQIVQLLDDRNMSFSFCLNRNKMLTLCGLSLLYQSIDLKQEGKLMKDGQRFVQVVINYLDQGNAAGASELRMLVSSIMSLSNSPPRKQRHCSENSLPRPAFAKTTIHRAASISNQTTHPQSRRSTLPSITLEELRHHSSRGHSSQGTINHDTTASQHEYPAADNQLPPPSLGNHHVSSPSRRKPNLDYFPLGNTPAASGPRSPPLARSLTLDNHTPIFPIRSADHQPQKMTQVSPSEWESLLGSLDGGQTNIYDAVYGGPALSIPASSHHAASTSSVCDDWSPEEWDMATLSMHDFDLGAPSSLGGPGGGGVGGGGGGGVAKTALSVLSFSEESLSSGDDHAGSDFLMGSVHGNGHGGQGHLTAGGNAGADYRNFGEGFLHGRMDANHTGGH